MQTIDLFILVEWMAEQVNSDRLAVPKSFLAQGAWSAIAGGHTFDFSFTDTVMTATADGRETERYLYRLDGQTLTATTGHGEVTMQVYMADIDTPNLIIDGIIFHQNSPECH